MRDWFTPQALADMRLPGMPTTDRRIRTWAEKNLAKTRKKLSGKGIEIHIAALPTKVQAAINVHLALNQAAAQVPATQPAPTFPVRGGEPIPAGIPSPAVTSPAATATGGLFPADGALMLVSCAGTPPALPASSATAVDEADFFAAGMAAGAAMTETKAQTLKRVGEAERRLRIIKPILEFSGKGKSDFALTQATAHGESRATLYRWIGRYQHGGFQALLDKPRADRHQARVVVSQVWETAATGCGIAKAVQLEIAKALALAVRGLWAQQGLNSARQVSLLAYPVLHKASLAAGMPEYIADHACKLPRSFVEPERRYAIVATATRDGKGFYDKHQTSIVRSRGGLKPGDIVFGDVSPADIPVTRPDGSLGWARLIAWQDAATNMLHITGFLAPPGSGVRREHVALAFAAMCEEAPWGMPRRLYLDNGSEYSWTEMLDAWRDLAEFSAGAFGGAWGDEALGPEGRVIRSIPFKPRAKSLEGQFGNLLRFFAWHPSFSGSDRMRKKVASLGKGATGTPLEDLKTMTGQALAMYHGTPQSGHLGGMSPAEKMAECLSMGYRRTTVNADALALAFSERLERKVRAGQVEAGRWYYYHPDLHMYEGETVLVRWPRHAPDAAYVFRKGVFLCAAVPAPVFAFADPAGAKHAGKLASEARRAVSVMKGQVAWLDPRDLMGEFAKLARVERVIDAAAKNQRVISVTAEAQAMIDGKQAAVMALIEQVAGAKQTLLDRRFDHSADADVEAARALGY